MNVSNTHVDLLHFIPHSLLQLKSLIFTERKHLGIAVFHIVVSLLKQNTIEAHGSRGGYETALNDETLNSMDVCFIRISQSVPLNLKVVVIRPGMMIIIGSARVFDNKTEVDQEVRSRTLARQLYSDFKERLRHFRIHLVLDVFSQHQETLWSRCALKICSPSKKERDYATAPKTE